jgi:hypothetical protein
MNMGSVLALTTPISTPRPAPDGTAVVMPFPKSMSVIRRLEIAAERMKEVADTLRVDAGRLAADAASLERIATGMEGNIGRLETARLRICAEGDRARRIAADAGKIEQMILAGDIAGCRTLRSQHSLR